MPAVAECLGRNGAGAKRRRSEAHVELGYVLGRAEWSARRLCRNFGSHAIGASGALEHFETLVDLGAHCPNLGQHLFDADFIFQIDAKVRVRFRAILGRLPILAHHDERPLK
jgi:hypothetical protein